MESEKIEKQIKSQKTRVGLIIGIFGAIGVFLLIILFPKKKEIEVNNKNPNEIDDLRNELKNELNNVKSELITKNREILELKKTNKELNNGKTTNRSNKSDKKATNGIDGEEGTGTTEEGNDDSTEDD